jgi:hypothetical protein
MEEKEQSEFVKWFRAKHPDLAKGLRVSMAGMKRTGRRAGAMMWNKMKSLGVTRGEPDIAILIARGGYHSLVIEHKGEGMARQLTDEQQEHLDWHASQGNKAIQTRGLDELKEAVEEYLDAE